MGPELMAKLGKHRSTKGCVYIKRLEDIDLNVLSTIFKKSSAVVKKVHPAS